MELLQKKAETMQRHGVQSGETRSPFRTRFSFHANTCKQAFGGRQIFLPVSLPIHIPQNGGVESQQ